MVGISTEFIKYIAVAFITVLVAGALWYISGLKADIAVHEANAQTYAKTIETQKETILKTKEEVTLVRKANGDLQIVIDTQAKDLKKLNDKFRVNARGHSRDFGGIAAAKPKLVEKLVNRGTLNAFRCTEITMGSPIKKGEKNNECQNLIDNITSNDTP